MYSSLEPAKTHCPYCEYCYQYTDEQFIEFEAKDTVFDTFEGCDDCTGCDDCKNGVGLKSPPGLKGHTLVSGQAGVIVYGGTKWTKTNHTIQDKINQDMEFFNDVCRDALAKVN
jgi:hypothetical protein